MTLQQIVRGLERHPRLPKGAGERFSGYGIVGVPFESGHVLAMRRFTASSLGQPYTSVWHRDPRGRWTFYTDVRPDYSCARYFGGQVERNVVARIAIEWTGPVQLRIAVDRAIAWEVVLAASRTSRLLSACANAMPGGARGWSPVLGLASRAVHLALGTGRLNFAGRTPNGHQFLALPRHVAVVASSRATVHGVDVGQPAPLPEQAAVGDFRFPQRGLLAVVDVRFERPPARPADRAVRPCSLAAPNTVRDRGVSAAR